MMIVWRNEPLVYQRHLDEAELPLLTALVGGTRFGVICEQLADGRSPEAATEIAFRLLVGWATDGLIAAEPRTEGGGHDWKHHRACALQDLARRGADSLAAAPLGENHAIRDLRTDGLGQAAQSAERDEVLRRAGNPVPAPERKHPRC